MSLLRTATAQLAEKDPEFRKALAAEMGRDERDVKRNVRLENDGSWATIEWMTPKDIQKERWEIAGVISMTNPFSDKTEEMPYIATLDLNANQFFKILEWQSDPQLRPAMDKLVWDERLKVIDALPTEEVATWEKLGSEEHASMTDRVARRYLLGSE